MAKFLFLSDEWVAAARALRAEYSGRTPRITAFLRANLVITDVPFGAGQIEAYLDTSSGEMDIELGRLEPADATLTLDYNTAKAQIVEQDQAAVIQAFMSGRMRIDGDLAKVLGLAATNPPPSAEDGAAVAELAQRLRDLTD